MPALQMSPHEGQKKEQDDSMSFSMIGQDFFRWTSHMKYDFVGFQQADPQYGFPAFEALSGKGSNKSDRLSSAWQVRI